MKSPQKSNIISTGLAMFSMFFGAGNVVFPLALGQYAEGHTFFAILGLLITAVGVPFMGLMAMTLFDGNTNFFFERIGKKTGFMLMVLIMGLIGPFGALPRCIALSASTLQIYFPEMSLPLFIFGSCFIIFAFTFKKNSILDVLGYVLTPILLLSLGFIIVKGLLISPSMNPSSYTESEIFLKGLKEGYQTMDLFGAFFFSSIVLSCLKSETHTSEIDPKEKKIDKQKNDKKLIKMTLQASLIGALLLSLVYIGFSFVAAFHSEHLMGVAQDKLIGQTAIQVLGPSGGIVVCVAVALACLTTAIALAAVFADFIQKEISNNKIGYIPALVGTLCVTFLMSSLNFNGISKVLLPVLEICYPALILLSILNILFKLYHFKPVKAPVIGLFVLSLIGYLVGVLTG